MSYQKIKVLLISSILLPGLLMFMYNAPQFLDVIFLLLLFFLSAIIISVEIGTVFSLTHVLLVSPTLSYFPLPV